MPVNPRIPTSDEDRIGLELREIRQRVDELERPTGTQRYLAVQKLTALVEDIQAQLDAYNANRWTNEQIAAQITSQVNAAIAAAFAGNVSITGSLTVNGALAAASLSTGGALTAGGLVTLSAVRGTSVSSASNRAAVWTAGDGRIGTTA